MFLVAVAGPCHIPVSGRLHLRECQDQDTEEGEEEDGVGREERNEKKELSKKRYPETVRIGEERI